MKTIEGFKIKKSIEIQKMFYTSKRFQGIVISFDFDVPQAMNKTLCVIKLKFLFFGFWIDFTKKLKLVPIKSEYKSGGLIAGIEKFDCGDVIRINRVSCMSCGKIMEVQNPGIAVDEKVLCAKCSLSSYLKS